ncbi:MAG TPA: hypothetical protein VK524_17940 [Polyangiaceae bacterium]|nr:hypothetical protein [Polyangiaceae bacterium]
MKTLAFDACPRIGAGARQRAARSCFAGALVATLLGAAGARAQEVDDTTKNAARELAHRAAAAYDRGDYKTAQDLFHRAHTLVPAPTLSLREARALEKLGRLVEAVEAYVRTVRAPLDAQAPDAFKQAVQQAQDELTKIRPRVPQLRIVVERAAPGDTLNVTLDGKPLQRALIGVEMPINPGAHEISVSTNSGAGARARLTLREAETQVATLKLEPGASADTGRILTDASLRPDTMPERDAGSAQRTWAYVGFGVGGAGLGTGVIAGLLAANRHSSAQDNCPDGKCAPGSSGAKDVEAFRSLRTVSTVSYLFGIAGVGAGVTLLLTAPKRAEAGQLRPFVGIGRLGVQGRF